MAATLLKLSPQARLQICSPPSTVEEAARTMNVSPRAVAHAKVVIEQGTPQLQEAVKDRTLSVSDAAQVAREPATVQDQAVSDVRAGKAKTARAAAGLMPPPATTSATAKGGGNAAPLDGSRQGKLDWVIATCRALGDDAEAEDDAEAMSSSAGPEAEDDQAEPAGEDEVPATEAVAEVTTKPLTDPAGRPIPERCRERYKQGKKGLDICKALKKASKAVQANIANPAARGLHLHDLKEQLDEHKCRVGDNLPSHVCPYCQGAGESPDTENDSGRVIVCNACKGDGLVSRVTYKGAPEDLKKG
jgi:hypothetical protein